MNRATKLFQRLLASEGARDGDGVPELGVSAGSMASITKPATSLRMT